jgi:glycosyltransferase involved in cell wall biosynthesis
MPSRREGFGLVGLEAIGAAVPVLVSDRSGLAELLRELLGTDEANRYYIVSVQDDLNLESQAWARRIDFVLRDQKAADQRAVALRDRVNESLSWDRSVLQLLTELDILTK